MILNFKRSEGYQNQINQQIQNADHQQLQNPLSNQIQSIQQNQLMNQVNIKDRQTADFWTRETVAERSLYMIVRVYICTRELVHLALCVCIQDVLPFSPKHKIRHITYLLVNLSCLDIV